MRRERVNLSVSMKARETPHGESVEKAASCASFERSARRFYDTLRAKEAIGRHLNERGRRLLSWLRRRYAD